MDIGNVVAIEIGPTIGIARVGNSPDAFFVGPEAPGYAPNPPGGFKDNQGRIKRQAARFRLYGLDAEGRAITELTAKHGDITWTVHLANRKGAWHRFTSRFEPLGSLRNGDIQNSPSDPDARRVLVIDPGPRSIQGRRKKGPRFDGGSFRGQPVALGELRTDGCGRLLVLGGMGHSASTRPNNPIKSYANNDAWHDDTSDGPVTAEIRLKDGRVLKAAASRVIVTPPDFAPAIGNITTLYQIVELASDRHDLGSVSFMRDIYPILHRLVQLQWVNERSLRGHGPGKPGDLMSDENLPRMASNSDEHRPFRQAVFDRIRDPRLDYDSDAAIAQANYRFMPALAGDGGDPVMSQPKTWLRLPVSVYSAFEAWARGDFEADYTKPEPQPSFEEIPVAEQPHALTRANLEACTGGPFYPGIEMTYIAEDPAFYGAPYRLRADIEPGGITKYMAVPWQADFAECNVHWWPAQRPDDVVPEAEYEAVMGEGPPALAAGGFPVDGVIFPGGSIDADAAEAEARRLLHRERWDRGLDDAFQTAATDVPAQPNAMVDLWSELGFIQPTVTPSGEVVFVERERAPYAGISIRDAYYYLSNITEHVDFLPKAKALVDHYLAVGWNSQLAPGFPDSWRYFSYSDEAFEARLEELYNIFVEESARYDPATDPIFKTSEDVMYYLWQTTPFDLNDGAWLRRITPAGPLTPIDALMFSIWMDEAGDGRVEWSHCNVFMDLLHSIGRFLPDSRSRDFADDPRFLDSAFVIPTLKLAISQFSTLYYPELLGFTLELEWAAVTNKPIARLMEYYGINSHFYTLHTGIDNATSGHGGRIRQVIPMYLNEIRRHGGDAAVQLAWKRIWTGFLTFGNVGNMGNDVINALKNKPSPADEVAAIMTRKQHYGSMNHDHKQIGPNRINDWFADPPGFMRALVDAGYIIPGDIDGSPFFKLTGFDGPMFKVFDDDELASWRRWTLWLAEDHDVPSHLDYGVEMARTIDDLRPAQSGVHGHEENALKGPDVNRPGNIIEQSVAAWFAGASTPAGVLAFMTALAHPDNGWIIPGDPDQSRFITELLAPSRPMGSVFNDLAPGTGGLTHRQIAIGWVERGCSIPKLNTTGGQQRYRLFAPPADTSVYPPPHVRGMGAIH